MPVLAKSRGETLIFSRFSFQDHAVTQSLREAPDFEPVAFVDVFRISPAKLPSQVIFVPAYPERPNLSYANVFNQDAAKSPLPPTDVRRRTPELAPVTRHEVPKI